MAKLDDQERDELLDLFYDIDLDGSHTLSRREIREHLEREGKTQREIEKIISRFDLNKSGHITLEEWCHELDLDHNHVHPREQHLPEDITVISQDMHIRLQRKIAEMALNALARNDETKDAVKELKLALDKRLDRLWQCIIIKGQYWAFYSHEPKHSFVFRTGSNIVLVWRTPAY